MRKSSFSIVRQWLLCVSAATLIAACGGDDSGDQSAISEKEAIKYCEEMATVMCEKMFECDPTATSFFYTTNDPSGCAEEAKRDCAEDDDTGVDSDEESCTWKQTPTEKDFKACQKSVENATCEELETVLYKSGPCVDLDNMYVCEGGDTELYNDTDYSGDTEFYRDTALNIDTAYIFDTDIDIKDWLDTDIQTAPDTEDDINDSADTEEETSDSSEDSEDTAVNTGDTSEDTGNENDTADTESVDTDTGIPISTQGCEAAVKSVCAVASTCATGRGTSALDDCDEQMAANSAMIAESCEAYLEEQVPLGNELAIFLNSASATEVEQCAGATQCDLALAIKLAEGMSTYLASGDKSDLATLIEPIVTGSCPI